MATKGVERILRRRLLPVQLRLVFVSLGVSVGVRRPTWCRCSKTGEDVVLFLSLKTTTCNCECIGNHQSWSNSLEASTDGEENRARVYREARDQGPDPIPNGSDEEDFFVSIHITQSSYFEIIRNALDLRNLDIPAGRMKVPTVRLNAARYQLNCPPFVTPKLSPTMCNGAGSSLAESNRWS